MNFKNAMISDIFEEILSERDNAFPEYTTRDKSDFGVMMMWVFSVIMKFFSDWVYRLFKNMFIGSAIDREYIIENAIERGYRPRGVISSRQLLKISTSKAITIPKGTRFQTDSGIIYETLNSVSSPSGGGDVYVYAIQGDRKEEYFVSSGIMNQEIITNNYPYVEGSIEVIVIDNDSIQEYKITDNIVYSGISDYVFMCHSDKDGRAVITFGNGYNGNIPPLNATIKVSFLVGKGKAGNVENDTITNLVSPMIGVVSVTNIRARNTVVRSMYHIGDTVLLVEDTSSFPSSGKAFVGDMEFEYISKTDKSFNGVSGLIFPIPVGKIVSAFVDNIVDGLDLETDSEIKTAAMSVARMNNRIVSADDYVSFLQSQPSIAWAKCFQENNILHLLAMPVDGSIMTDMQKTVLISKINKIAVPTTRYFLEDPVRVAIDVAIEIEIPIGYVYESDEIVSESPLLYKGVYNNVVNVIKEYLSPVNNRSATSSVITLRAFDIYKLVSELPDNQVKNCHILSFGKSVAEPVKVSVENDIVTISEGRWRDLEPGDVIKIIESQHGNDKFVKVIEQTAPDKIRVNYTFVSEDNLSFYYASDKDVQISGKQVPDIGAIFIVNKSKSKWYDGSINRLSYPYYEIESGIK